MYIQVFVKYSAMNGYVLLCVRRLVRMSQDIYDHFVNFVFLPFEWLSIIRSMSEESTIPATFNNSSYAAIRNLQHINEWHHMWVYTAYSTYVRKPYHHCRNFRVFTRLLDRRNGSCVGRVQRFLYTNEIKCGPCIYIYVFHSRKES